LTINDAFPPIDEIFAFCTEETSESRSVKVVYIVHSEFELRTRRYLTIIATIDRYDAGVGSYVGIVTATGTAIGFGADFAFR